MIIVSVAILAGVARADGADDGLRVLLDRTAVPRRVAEEAGRPGGAPLRLVVDASAPRVLRDGQPGVLAWPVAWRLEASRASAAPGPGGNVPHPWPAGGASDGEGIWLDPTAGSALRRDHDDEALATLIRATFVAASEAHGLQFEEAGPPPRELLDHVPAVVPLDPRAAAGTVRLLLRGAVAERWAVRSSGDDLAPEDAVEEVAPARAASHAGYVVLLSLEALARHAEGSAYPLPAPLLHATLRLRAWDLADGRKAWDRTVLVGSRPAAGESRTTPGAAEWLTLLEGATRVLADLAWGPPADPVAAHGAAPEAPPVAEAQEGPPAPVGPTTLDEALALLAARRLAQAPATDPWRALEGALADRVDPARRLLLRCAQDPLATAAELASERLGVGLADAAARLEESPALRRVVVGRLVGSVAENAPDDPALPAAAELLLADLGGAPPSPEAQTTARGLLERSFPEGPTGGPAALADVLLVAVLWPDEARDGLARALEGVPGPPAPPPAGVASPRAGSGDDTWAPPLPPG